MSANNFTKQEKQMFEEVSLSFEEALLWTGLANGFNELTPQEMERTDETVWREMPLMVGSNEGIDQTGNFGGVTDLSVPISVTRHRNVSKKLDALELRDPSRLKRVGDSAKKALASDVNMAIRRYAGMHSSIVDVKSGGSSGYDDVARMETLFDELGVPTDDRIAVYSTRDLQNIVSDLANRHNMKGKHTVSAYEKSLVNEIANFAIHKDPSALKLEASTVTNATVAQADQRHIPKAHIEDNVGEIKKIDNRTMKLRVNGTGWKAGDAFTIAGVYAVHHTNKTVLNELKTFRVVNVIGTDEIEIMPAIICDDYEGATEAETAYKNVSATPANNSAITMLNTKTAYVNPFFVRDVLEIMPSKLALEQHEGMKSLSYTLDNGMTLYYSKQASIDNLSFKVRWDVRFGAGILNPEMAGIQLFNQG